MKREHKRLVRLALAIDEQRKTSRRPPPPVELPINTWQICQQLQRRITRARQRGWKLAERRSRRDLRRMLDNLCGHLRIIEAEILHWQGDKRPSGVGDVYADLRALQREFEDVSFDVGRQTLAVTTEPIELEGVDLGRFQICLDWSHLDQDRSRPYRVVALDPNSAASNHSVTHPHVQDETVCEGEGHHAIVAALAEGRLLDFFLIVAGILRTYNCSSPYVSLAEWHGTECSDCGTLVGDEDRWNCEQCESSICGDCYLSCPSCDGIYCGNCVSRCEACDLDICGSCLQLCVGCRAARCPECLDENERCNNCYDREAEAASEIDDCSMQTGPEVRTGAPI
ncbi:MAG: hypothetical protein DWQ35_12110 [Planctomycetota bacterium]|nr:MAG: hypothetical protein DWQ35_12110 [Planctomycetota bacterium]REK30363.1 MAG: hypothetical protein DWQ42_01765 [Planctomycetota bacterium]REK40246.1 MAG: hypothetical protein DWQ46_16810 [Planctomycetota bacterium]